MSKAAAVIPTDSTDGELPAGWTSSTLGQLGRWVTGSTPSTKNPENYGNAIPFVGPGDIGYGTLLLEVNRGLSETGMLSARIVEPPSVLLVCIGATLGKVSVSFKPVTTNQQINSLEVNPAVADPLFGNYLLASPAQQELLWQNSSSTTVPIINKKSLQSIPVAIPPLAEQEQIVEILEEQLSRLDAALESVRVVRKKAAQFRRSLLHAAFTGTLTDHIPADDWDVRNLSEVATLSLGKMLDRKQHTGLNPTHYLRNINVRWGSIQLNDLQVMDVTPEQLERVSLRSGDIVVCEGGEPGRAAVWMGAEGIAIQKALHRVRVANCLDPVFTNYLFENEFRGAGDHPLFTGTTIKHLPKEKIATVKVPVPPLAEQKRIVEILEEQLSRLDAALAVADGVEKRSAALRRSLLHAAFTGRLTEQWREQTNV